MISTKGGVDQWVVEYQQGELEFDELFKKFEKLIHDCFWRFLKKHQWECPTLESEDLKSVCYLAFYKSAKGFDIRKGYAFSTYFYKTAYFSMLQEYRKHLGERPLSLNWEEEEGDSLLNFIGVDGFSESRRLEWLEYMKEVMERKKFEPNMVEAILIHLETREPLYKVASRYGIYQVKASRYLTKLKKELRVAG
ncbi:sigma factor [Turicibacter sanguinis]|uniref:sigma factor n=1 Tax=Turicibacter sanguinis TaxID=154288 RepID=UPI00232B60DC|nr:sigma factor [Turicibacter sanguinis]MDB8575573.1 sigma factor [Turicibacter sanguinis]MDB8578791.1 sigma factor [Turicibacter sanguinis]MDB8585243.1 sigma factor [Turicibacter sanguinis]MDB8588250.1 sigma factor [Turicibacter sanguinis]MDB8599058.1 sigma factor [Turicibacter sanguinis]